MGIKEILLNEGIKLGAYLIKNRKPKITTTIPTTQDLEEQLAQISSQESPISPIEGEKVEIKAEDEVAGGTAGNLCSDEHLTQASADIDEALRMARSRGVKDNEVRGRLKRARSELNQMERDDMVPTKLKNYPEEQQEIARWALVQSSSLRHQINDILIRDRSIEDLENLTATTNEVSSEFTDRIDKLPAEQKETDACVIYTERAKPVSKTELPPEIEALKRMVEERKQEK